MAEIIDKEHSSRSASQAYRWMTCTGQPALVEELIAQGMIPERDEGSVYSKRGTVAHHVAIEECLKKDLSPQAFVGYEMDGVEMEQEDIDAIQVFVDYVRGVMRSDPHPFTAHLESQFKLNRIHPLLWGTADTLFIAQNLSKLVVVDYKHGAGVPVEVEDNLQGKYYGLGGIEAAINRYDLQDLYGIVGWGRIFKQVEIGIVQPRCYHKDGPIRSWVVPPKELDAFSVKLKVKVEETLDPERRKLVPGDHCRWCRAIGHCKAVREYTQGLAKVDFQGVSNPVNLKFPPTVGFSDQELVKLAKFSPIAQDFFKAVGDEVHRRLSEGNDLNGEFKLVKKRTNRKWKDEEQTELALVDDLGPEMYTTNLNSPAKMEKLLTKEQQEKLNFKDLYYTPDGGLTVAPKHDKRQAVLITSAEKDFENVEKPE